MTTSTVTARKKRDPQHHVEGKTHIGTTRMDLSTGKSISVLHIMKNKQKGVQTQGAGGRGGTRMDQKLQGIGTHNPQRDKLTDRLHRRTEAFPSRTPNPTRPGVK